MFKTIRTNPKKSVFVSMVLGYGCYYADNKFKQYQYRRKLCNEAKCLGEEHIGPTQELTRVTVVYNPVANNRKSSSVFNKNVYPLLNLSGYKVTLAETERPEEGKELMGVLKPTDQECICIAGGDGTLMEVVTGLLRRDELRSKMKLIPLVLVPLGYYNSFAKRNNFIKLDDDIGTYDEAIKLIRKGQLKPYNVIELKVNRTETEEVDETKPKTKEIFAVSGLEWSIDRDVMKIGKGKWMFGPYRYHWQYFLSAVLGKHTKTNKSATLIYQDLCSGCSKCTPANPDTTHSSGSKFSVAYFLFPMFYKTTIAKEKEQRLEYEEKIRTNNDNCGVTHEKHLTDIRGLSVVLNNEHLEVKIKKAESDFFEYISSGVSGLETVPYSDSEAQWQDRFTCDQLRIIPETVTGEHYYVDNEQLETVPLELRVLKDAVFIYS